MSTVMSCNWDYSMYIYICIIQLYVYTVTIENRAPLIYHYITKQPVTPITYIMYNNAKAIHNTIMYYYTVSKHALLHVITCFDILIHAVDMAL